MVLNAVLIAAATLASAARLPPIDQCTGDASFVRFRSSLQAIVARRDAQALLETVADDVMVDFGAGSQGPREFARVWSLDAPAKAKASPVWRELALILRLGCARVGPSRIVPSLVEQLSDDDQFDKLLALPGAKLRQSPDTGAPVLAILNYHVVTFEEGDAPEGWARVSLSTGRKGYVRRSALRAALQYRAQFEQVGGRWRLMSFVEGD